MSHIGSSFVKAVEAESVTFRLVLEGLVEAVKITRVVLVLVKMG